MEISTLQETDGLTNQLYRWIETAQEPLSSYATGHTVRYSTFTSSQSFAVYAQHHGIKQYTINIFFMAIKEKFYEALFRLDLIC